MKKLLVLMVSLSIYVYSIEVQGDSGREKNSAVRSFGGYPTIPERPKRIDTPLRYPNISDREVGEVKAAVQSVYPGAIANIGSVVAGCSCEDGPMCTSQVWVVAYNRGKYNGLMLSRIEDEWQVGPLQEWWLEYEELLIRIQEVFRGSRSDFNFRFWEEYEQLADERYRLLSIAPSCVVKDNLTGTQ